MSTHLYVVCVKPTKGFKALFQLPVLVCDGAMSLLSQDDLKLALLDELISDKSCSYFSKSLLI